MNLRPYQEEAVKAFLDNEGKGTIRAAPGSGKTIIAIAAAKAAIIRDGFMKVLILTITLDLVEQWKRFMTEYGFGPAEFDVITYAKGARLADRKDFWSMYGFIVVDEMHHLKEGPAFMRILVPIHKARYALGLSATPPTDLENVALRVLPVIYEFSLAESEAQGFAAPVEIHPVPVQLTEEERKRYNELTFKIRLAVLKGGSLKKAYTTPVGRNPETGEMEFAGQLMTQRKQLVAHADKKFVLLRDIVEQVLGLCDCAPSAESRPSRILVWSSYVAVLEKAKTELNRNGYVSELVTGKTPKKKRVQIWKDWGTRFHVLLTANVASEGIDVPECDTGILIAGSRTTRENLQRVGRLLRPLPNKTAKLWVLFAANTIEERLVQIINKVADE